MINVLLADDHEVVLEGLKSILQRDPTIKVIGEATSGEKVLTHLNSSSSIDIAVLDIEMKGLNGIETAKVIKKKHPQTKVLILSMYNQKRFIMELMKIGVSGYILKNESKEQLVHAIRQIHSGNAYFGLNILNTLSTNIDGKTEEKTTLTEREEQVLALIGEGQTTKEISTELKINETTVNTHKRNLRHKLDAANEKHLVRYAIKHGYSEL